MSHSRLTITPLSIFMLLCTSETSVRWQWPLSYNCIIIFKKLSNLQVCIFPNWNLCTATVWKLIKNYPIFNQLELEPLHHGLHRKSLLCNEYIKEATHLLIQIWVPFGGSGSQKFYFHIRISSGADRYSVKFELGEERSDGGAQLPLDREPTPCCSVDTLLVQKFCHFLWAA